MNDSFPEEWVTDLIIFNLPIHWKECFQFMIAEMSFHWACLSSSHSSPHFGLENYQRVRGISLECLTFKINPSSSSQ